MSEIVTDDGSAPSFKSLSREASDLDFDDRNKFLAGLTEHGRQKLFDVTPPETLYRWQREEQEHLEELMKNQPVERADFEGVEREVKVDGAETPQNRAPDVGADLIATLVQERFDAERKAAAETKRANDAERVATERAAELDAYYKAFGPLPED
jgi:hypothetical protein